MKFRAAAPRSPRHGGRSGPPRVPLERAEPAYGNAKPRQYVRYLARARRRSDPAEILPDRRLGGVAERRLATPRTVGLTGRTRSIALLSSQLELVLVSAAALKIAIVAISLGLDVFAVCVGVGMRGAGRLQKVRIGAAFALAEVAMTLVGVLLGETAGKYLGDLAGYLGFIALTLVGGYMVFEAVRGGEEAPFDLSRGWGLVLGALSISLDSLGIGFSILFIGVPLGVSIVSIAAASIVSTSFGLALGRALGARLEEYAAIWAGVILMLTGIAFAGLKFFGRG